MLTIEGQNRVRASRTRCVLLVMSTLAVSRNRLTKVILPALRIVVLGQKNGQVMMVRVAVSSSALRPAIYTLSLALGFSLGGVGGCLLSRHLVLNFFTYFIVISIHDCFTHYLQALCGWRAPEDIIRKFSKRRRWSVLQRLSSVLTDRRY